MHNYEMIFKHLAELHPDEIRFENDKFTKQKYLIFNTPECAIRYKSELADIISNKTEAAGFKDIKYLDFENGHTCCDYVIKKNHDKMVMVKLNKHNLIIIEGGDLASIRKDFLGDDYNYPYQITFKNAEFHAYPQLTNLITGKSVFPGTSVYPFNEFVGSKIVRDEVRYDKKYYKGNLFIESRDGFLNPKIDKGSFGIDLLITEAQFKIVHKLFHGFKTKFEQDFSHTQHLNNPEKSLLNKGYHYIYSKVNGINPYCFIDDNCHSDLQKIYNAIGFSDHFVNFMRADNLDLNDMGAYNDFWSAHGYIETFVNNFSTINNVLKQHRPKLFGKIKNKNYDLNNLIKFIEHNNKAGLAFAEIKDIDGNTAIHQALLSHDLNNANLLINYGIDLGIINKKGETPLHLAAILPPSAQKIELVTKMIASTDLINKPDLYKENIPLTMAVLADDPECIKLLVKHGANYNYVNLEYNNLGNICAQNNKINSAKALFEIDPQILIFDNWSRQIPIHDETIKTYLNTSYDIKISPKNMDALYSLIDDIDHFFSPALIPFPCEEI